MEEDDVDLLKPSKNEDMDAFLENDDLDEDVIKSQRRSRMKKTIQLPTKYRVTK